MSAKTEKGGGGVGWEGGKEHLNDTSAGDPSFLQALPHGPFCLQRRVNKQRQKSGSSFSWTHNFSLLRLLRQLLCAFGATASSRFGEKWLIEVSQSNSSGLFQCLNVIWGKSSILVIFFTCTLLVIFYVLYLTPCWEVYFIQLLRFFYQTWKKRRGLNEDEDFYSDEAPLMWARRALKMKEKIKFISIL